MSIYVDFLITCKSLKYLDSLVLMIFKNDGEIIKFKELSSETCIVTKYVFDLERSILSLKGLMI